MQMRFRIFVYTIDIIFAARFNIYDRHKNKHCNVKNKLQNLIHVCSYYKILINAKTLQYFVDAFATKSYRTISFSFKLGFLMNYVYHKQ